MRESPESSTSCFPGISSPAGSAASSACFVHVIIIKPPVPGSDVVASYTIHMYGLENTGGYLARACDIAFIGIPSGTPNGARASEIVLSEKAAIIAIQVAVVALLSTLKRSTS